METVTLQLEPHRCWSGLHMGDGVYRWKRLDPSRTGTRRFWKLMKTIETATKRGVRFSTGPAVLGCSGLRRQSLYAVVKEADNFHTLYLNCYAVAGTVLPAEHREVPKVQPSDAICLHDQMLEKCLQRLRSRWKITAAQFIRFA